MTARATASRSATPAAAKAAPRSRSRAAAKSTVEDGAKQTAIQQALMADAQAGANTGKPADAPAQAKAQTNDANLVVPLISHAAQVASVKAANAGFKAAVSLEVAVICSVFMNVGSTDVRAKKELYSVYADAGYDCKEGGGGKDYKTVNRRINYGTKFFESLKKDELKAVVGDARDEAAIQNLLVHIGGKYTLNSMSDVLAASGEVPAHRQIKNNPSNKGQTGSQGDGNQSGGSGGGQQGSGPQGGGEGVAQGQTVFGSTGAANPVTAPGPDAGDKGVMEAVGEAAAQREAIAAQARDPSKWLTFQFEGATVSMPVDMKTEALADLGIKLMTAAKEMHGANTVVAAVLNETFKEMAAAG